MTYVILACPICGRQPDIDECGPPTKETGPLGWYANCYGQTPHEHNVGVTADNRSLVEEAWNDEVGRIIRVKRREGIMSDGIVSI